MFFAFGQLVDSMSNGFLIIVIHPNTAFQLHAPFSMGERTGAVNTKKLPESGNCQLGESYAWYATLLPKCFFHLSAIQWKITNWWLFMFFLKHLDLHSVFFQLCPFANGLRCLVSNEQSCQHECTIVACSVISSLAEDDGRLVVHFPDCPVVEEYPFVMWN